MILYLGFVLDVLGFVLKGGLVADPAFLFLFLVEICGFVVVPTFMRDETHEDPLCLSSSSGSSVGSFFFCLFVEYKTLLHSLLKASTIFLVTQLASPMIVIGYCYNVAPEMTFPAVAPQMTFPFV
jgi:hypothetical protein